MLEFLILVFYFSTPSYQIELMEKPLVLHPNVTSYEEHLTQLPNRNFWDWLSGLFGNNMDTNPAIQPPATGQCTPCTCGLVNVKSRIIGGVVTKINQYPWMVALKYNNRFFCGGSLINSRYVLTAAHCTSGISKERLSAVFLEHDRSDPSESETLTMKIIGVYKHRSYNTGGSFNNDIALLKLENHVAFKSNLRPVCLPITGKSYTGSVGKVTGWGTTTQYGQVSTKLREVDVPILSNVECMKTKYGDRITANMLCAGFDEGGKDACQGDSGGPLTVLNGTQHSVVGIVSWGEGCAQKDYPGVYTRVNRFNTWIKTNTKDACFC